jgi:hypothetical protein
MKRSSRASEPLSGSKTKKSGCGNLGCALFALPFFLAGAFIIYFLFVGPALKTYEAQSWDPTPCTIISSKVVGDETYSVQIIYSYTVGGEQYQSDRYDFIEASTSSYEGKAEVVYENPAGSSATCYVNPQNPAEAVFSRDFSSDMWFGLFGLPFLLAGAFGLYIAAKSALKGRKGGDRIKAKPKTPYPTFETIRYRNPSPTALNESDSQPSGFESPSFPQTSFPQTSFQESSFQPTTTQQPPVIEPVKTEIPFEAEKPFEKAGLADIKKLAETAWGNPLVPVAKKSANPFERTVLEPKISPGCKLTAMIVIAVVWNVLVAAFGGWRIKGSWNDDFFGLMPSLFFSPFELIGIFLFILAGYFLLALFNPRPRLILSGGQVRLGEPFDLEWEFSGSTHAIKHFYLDMEGWEFATYRRGTDTTTDKSLFAKIIIADRPNASRGSSRVTVPANTMHTFNSENNKIVWSLQLRGDIRGWPDVTESFVIEVLPGRSAKTGDR